MSRDDAVRRAIYTSVMTSGAVPRIDQLSAETGLDSSDVTASLRTLAAGRIVVLQPGSGEILMAPPFSAVPTPFLVTTSDRRAYANCMWDALGVPVMWRQHARIETSCGCCGEAIVGEADPDRPPEGDGLVHFGVPARRWWDDLVFT